MSVKSGVGMSKRIQTTPKLAFLGLGGYLARAEGEGFFMLRLRVLLYAVHLWSLQVAHDEPSTPAAAQGRSARGVPHPAPSAHCGQG